MSIPLTKPFFISTCLCVDGGDFGSYSEWLRRQSGAEADGRDISFAGIGQIKRI